MNHAIVNERYMDYNNENMPDNQYRLKLYYGYFECVVL